MTGVNPVNEAEVNNTVGLLLRQFTDIREGVAHHYNWLQPTELTQPPYNMSTQDETLIKSAVNGLYESLQAIDMTFIRQLTGIWT